MNKKIISIAIFIVSILFFSSCEDELNIEKMGNLGAEEDFYKTDADADAAITCCYIDLGSLYEGIMSTSNLMSDDIWCGGGQKNDNSQREDIGAYTFGPTNENIQDLFSGLYTLIYHANLVIEKFETYDTETKKQALAEAYFFRGFAHFYLGAFFGTAPVVDHLLGTDEYEQPNSTKVQLFEQAVSDLEIATESGDMVSKTDINTNSARVTNEAALSYLGKVYVFLEDWDKAATALDKVISSEKYELYNNYEDILHSASDFCSENILEWNAVTDYSNFLNNINLYFIYNGFRGDFYDWGVSAEYSDISNSAYGFYNPTASLYNAFVSEEGIDGFRLNQTIKTYAQLKDIGITILAGKVLHGHEGYWNWKNRFLNSDFIIYGLFPVVNFRFMRYSEVLLLAAEAQLMNGDGTKAEEYLNEVRERAQLSAKSGITIADVKLEKRLELFNEGCRWMDLVRWGDAADVLNDKGKTIIGFDGDTESTVVEYTNSSSDGFVEGKHEVLPIPDTEVTLNGNLEQNPNW